MKSSSTMKRFFALMIVVITIFTICLSGCNKSPFDPKNPVTITMWHYYNGSILNAFDDLVRDFNDTIGKEKGIIIESSNYGSVSELEKAVKASTSKEVGSEEMPNIFASYADTAYEAEKNGILANLGDYFTAQEQSEYIDSYIEEGKIGLNGELRIFPIAKSTETLMLNDTDWTPFAAENNLTYDNLATNEGLAAVSKLYYEWTDAKTPDIANDGKAFFGRDSIANMFIIASKELGVEIFEVKDGKCTLNISDDVMKKIWDNYYIPYISGYFTSYGKFRSDDLKVGDVLSYVGSTASASYFPDEVTINEEIHEITAKVLPAPYFENATKVMVQQGAGMVVTKSTEVKEAASVEFLKFFTDVSNNSAFSAMSGYMPVKKEATDYEKFSAILADKNQEISANADATIKIAFEEIKTSELYTNKAFSGGSSARNILDTHLQDKAKEDRDAVKTLLEDGKNLEEAVATCNTEENFQNWLSDFKEKLEAAIE